MSRATRTLAVTVSALLGVAGGVVVGLVVDRGHPEGDPLDLGVRMVNQPCTSKYLLVTIWGDRSARVAPGISPGSHYLQVDASCHTAWRPHGTRTDGYIAYLGPYDNGFQACGERVQHRGSFVTRLNEGNQDQVPCLCYLSEESLPELTPGQAVDATDQIYVRVLQDLLTSMGLLPGAHHFIGRYDQLTVGAVKKVQAEANLTQNGVLDQDTWTSVKRQGCQNLSD